jgi:superfamily II DNA helicase RecQ
MKRYKISAQTNKLMAFALDKFFDGMYKSVVVLANPKTILNDRYAPKDIKNKVIRADQLGKYIKKLYSESKDSPVGDNDLLKYAERLLSNHQPKETDYLKKYYDLLDEQNKIAESVGDTVKETNNNANNFDTNKLYEALRKYRLEKSRSENIKPYYIFNNKQLDHLIEVMPKSFEDLLKVNGFGQVKAEKYGDEILAIIENNM